MKRPMSIAALSAMILAATTAAKAGEAATTPPRTISVSATGSVVVTPDEATINAGVTNEAETARGALSSNTKAMTKVVDGLKAAGIEAKDIQTSNFQLNPRYQNSGISKGGDTRAIVGYTATNQARVKLRDVARTGEILDALVSLGANQMNGISFDVSNAEKLRDDARKAAMANARRRAELYATAAGVSLGPVVTISESAEFATANFGNHALFASAAKGAPVPVEAGSQRLDATVYVTSELK